MFNCNKLIHLAAFLSFLAVASGEITNSIENETNSINTRVVGGIPANLGQFPYQGFLVTSDGFCGCSLISESWAVTAAHCIIGEPASSSRVYFGSIFPFSGTMVEVARLFVHPDYNSNTLENDIGLIELDSNVQFNSNIGTIDLPAQGENVAAGTICSISGFGDLDNFGTRATALQSATVPIVSDSDCSLWYSQSRIMINSEVQFCAGYQNGGVDTCSGDSGGPLACQSSLGRPVLQGITSFGIGCALAERPGVYTRTSAYIFWIATIIPSTALPSTSTSTLNNESLPSMSCSESIYYGINNVNLRFTLSFVVFLKLFF